jgi:hypothetical protein
MFYRLTGAILLLAANTYIAAAAETVEGTAQGQTNKDIRIGVYVNIQPDCTSGPLPTIRLVEPPAHGKVTVKKGNVNATNYKECLALSVPAYVAFYHSDKDFLGNDSVLLEVRYPGGKQELQHIVITVRETSADQSILRSNSARGLVSVAQSTLFHQLASSPQRCPSRWCPRQSGTVNSSLTLRSECQ